MFAGFALIALRSDRFWPLWVAGLQLTTSIRPLPQGDRHSTCCPTPMRAAQCFWSYPILLILAVGTWRSIAADETRAATSLPLDARLARPRRCRHGRAHVAPQEIASKPRDGQPAALVGQACRRGGARQSRTQGLARLGDARSGGLHAISQGRRRSRSPTSPTLAGWCRTMRRIRAW